MKPYISWSELYTFLKDENEHYVKYVMGVKEPPTPPMIFGSIIHEALSDPNYDYEMALRVKNFTSGEIRVARSLVDRTPRFEPHSELSLYLAGSKENGLSASIIAILDRADFKSHTIREYKSTKNGWRDQEEMRENGQLGLYTLVYRELMGVKPMILLTRLDSGNGKVAQFDFIVEDRVVNRVMKEVNDMYAKLTRVGWWERRLSSSNTLLEEAKANTEQYALRKHTEWQTDILQQGAV